MASSGPKISAKDVEHVARLARLDLSAAEKERMGRELVRGQRRQHAAATPR